VADLSLVPAVQTLDDVLGPEPEPEAPKRPPARRMYDVAVSVQSHLTAPVSEGIKTGILPLDACIGSGWRPGDTAVVAAGTGVGKSLLGAQIARNACRFGHVLYISAEMPAEKLFMRMLTAETSINTNRLRDSKVYDNEWMGQRGLTASLDRLAALDMSVLDDGDFTITDVEETAAECQNLVMVAVDYGQMIEGDDGAKQRSEAVTKVSRRLKRMAVRLKCVVVVMAQTNRNVDSRSTADKRLILSDISDSGSLARDASTVMMIEREVMGGNVGRARIRVVKNRDGECGEVDLAFNTNTLTFERLP
tara:strand:+ start:416 stop:1333 length:918 start_codon:yes stop_codon:yes gene_type:complete